MANKDQKRRDDKATMKKKKMKPMAETMVDKRKKNGKDCY